MSRRDGFSVSDHVYNSGDSYVTYSLSDFKSRCCEQLAALGDIAVDARQRDEAIAQYSAALTLNPTTAQALLAQRRKTRAVPGMWGNPLNDANEACHFCCIQVCRR